MSMAMGDMPMGSMSMGDGVPGLFTLQRMYWAVVGSAIAAATLVNILNHLLSQHRLRDSSLTPAKPKSLFWQFYATLTATAREVSYATIRPFVMGKYILHFPPLGPVLVILANLVVVLVLCFYKLETTDPWKWEDVGYRTGFITICQLPLIFLLAGRQNIIGLLVGMSYAQLNWFHRWAARILWLTATIHMGFWFRDWGRYDYISYQLHNDPLSKRGFAAWCILTFIVLTSIAPIRRLSYEIFVLQHLLTFAGFLAAVWLHAPNEVKVWVWISIGLVVFDRVARYTWSAFINISLFHPNGTKHPMWTHLATFTPLPGDITRVTIQNPGMSWQPGQHVFLTCHTVVPLQSHPFTISSLPEDKKLEFFIQAKNGGTRRFFRYASKYHQVLDVRERSVLVEGPYGRCRTLRQFNSVVLIAGGMGATFTMPLLRDIVSTWKKEILGEKSECSSRIKRLAATKRIQFVWIVKSHSQLALFETQLQAVWADIEQCRRTQPDFDKELDVCYYITCGETQKYPITTQSMIPLPAQDTSDRQNTISKPAMDLVEKDTTSVRSLSVKSLSGGLAQAGEGCPSVSKCCCVAQPMASQFTAGACTCPGRASADEKKPTGPVSSEAPAMCFSPLAGRPNLRAMIRTVLEKAEGESAVVVCGPRGLADDVRRNVVSLSDERAVHKGTGAQGIYLHVENFGW